jgi:isoamylase
LARVMTGSREVFGHSGRQPSASVNFVTAHDGFTLQDLVSYNERHNEANGEDNRDGHSHNVSWNCGVEGPTDDPAVLALRARQKRNFLATLMLSQGVPMILMGDELSRTQEGNNNAYAQDNPISWFDWTAGTAADPDLLAFTQTLVALRKRYDAFRRRAFLTGATVPGNGLKDVYWLAPEGREMTTQDWTEGLRRTLGMQLGNDAPDGQRFLILLNAAPEPVEFRLAGEPRGRWAQVFDTGVPDGLVRGGPAILEAGGTFRLDPRSLVLFQYAGPAEAQ